MSNEDDNGTNGGSGNDASISPDPRIIISSFEVTPPGRDEHALEEPAVPIDKPIKFIWQAKGDRAPRWYQKIGVNGHKVPYRGPIAVDAGVAEGPDDQGDLARLLDVTVTDRTGTFQASEAYKRQELTGGSAQFQVTASVGSSIEFRVDAGSARNPATSGYYIRSGTPGNYVFAAYDGNSSNPFQNVIAQDQYSVTKYNGLWVLPQAPWGSTFGIMSLYNSGDTNQFFSWVTVHDVYPTNLQMTSAFTGKCWWCWDAGTGLIYPFGATESCWTAASGSQSVVLDQRLSPLAASQIWNLVPAERGPTYDGEGVLGPSGS